MAASPILPDSDHEPASDRLEPGPEVPPRTPPWVKVFGIIALVLILAVAVQFMLGIRHGPGMHSLHESPVGLLVHL